MFFSRTSPCGQSTEYGPLFGSLSILFIFPFILGKVIQRENKRSTFSYRKSPFIFFDIGLVNFIIRIYRYTALGNYEIDSDEWRFPLDKLFCLIAYFF